MISLIAEGIRDHYGKLAAGTAAAGLASQVAAEEAGDKEQAKALHRAALALTATGGVLGVKKALKTAEEQKKRREEAEREGKAQVSMIMP